MKKIDMNTSPRTLRKTTLFSQLEPSTVKKLELGHVSHVICLRTSRAPRYVSGVCRYHETASQCVAKKEQDKLQ